MVFPFMLCREAKIIWLFVEEKTIPTIIMKKQVCIPVGCVPAARRPYAGVCFPGGSAWSGGVCLVGGSAWSGGCLPGLEGGGCLPGLGGVSAWSGGVCLVCGGCLLGPGGSAWSRGVCIPACTEADTLPPVDRILDTRLWKYYLGPTSLRPVTTAARRKTGIPSHLSSVKVRSHMTIEKTPSSCAKLHWSSISDTQIFDVFSIIFYVTKCERTVSKINKRLNMQKASCFLLTEKQYLIYF